ncbi:hypothetical protein DET57_14318 [Klebsiella oxytoca]|uniref:IS110 family transposase n=1 Tax=Klebsiella oxytoca TaxID=571 RepID=A0A318F2V5_KLEOX|nr:hypothetical protein DET57_14318 [Klebsiella oxytoca]
MFPVGIDVSKNTLDLCMLYDGKSTYQSQPCTEA